jgi:hypothetical protein
VAETIAVVVRVELTPKMPTLIPPVRTGVYRTHQPGANRYSYWNGIAWSPQRTTVAEAQQVADRYPRSRASFQRKEWQGLVREVAA